MSFKLIYWPDLPGRGEYVRLVLEACGFDYEDVAKGPKDIAIQAVLQAKANNSLYAPPFLQHNDHLLMSQTPLLCEYVAEMGNLAPKDRHVARFALSLALTIGDLVAEVHDTHHAEASHKYYEDQKDACLLRSKSFLAERLPRLLGYFESVIQKNGTGWLVGKDMTYVDIMLFQTLEGLMWAFPKAYATLVRSIASCERLREQVALVPRIKGYLQSDRRLAWNNSGIFRRYPELDES